MPRYTNDAFGLLIFFSVLQGKRKIRRGRTGQIRNPGKCHIRELAQHILRKWDLAEIRLKYIQVPGYIYIVLRWGRNTAPRSSSHCYFHTQYQSHFLLLFHKLVLSRDPREYQNIIEIDYCMVYILKKNKKIFPDFKRN